MHTLAKHLDALEVGITAMRTPELQLILDTLTEEQKEAIKAKLDGKTPMVADVVFTNV